MMWGPGEEGPSEIRDVDNMKAQLDHQQTFISQLKDKLRENKELVSEKEKELLEHATKLSNIRTRIKTSSSHTRKISVGSEKNFPQENEPVPEEAIQNQTLPSAKRSKTVSDKNRKGKMTMLRKKVEENRLKFEQRGKEITENKKEVEDMVEQLRTAVEERDKTIQDLQHGILSSPVSTAQIQDTTYLSHEMMNQQEVLVQLSLRDNRIHELEGKIIDLQENLKEKDSVLEARTKAVTLLSESLAKKGKTTLDNLEDTREQMRIMQNNFVSLEADMKSENLKLAKQLEENRTKLILFEEKNHSLEAARFDLSTRNAELQEKLVLMQDQILKQSEVDRSKDVTILQERIAELEEEKGTQAREKELLISQIETFKVRLAELEQCKVSAEMKCIDLEEQIETLQQENLDIASKFEKLQDSIGNHPENKPEEEKWNQESCSEKQEKDSLNLELSLRLLEAELEESKRIIEEQKDIIIDLEEKLQNRDEEIEIHKEVIVKVEEQMESKENDFKGDNIADIMRELKEMSGDLEEWKTRCCEVEERLIGLGSEKCELEENLEALRKENNHLNTKIKSFEELENKSAKLEEEYKLLYSERLNLEDLSSNLKDKNEQLKATITDISDKLLDLQAVVEKLNLEKSQLYEKLNKSEVENSHLLSQFEEYEGWKQISAELEHNLASIEQEKNWLKKELENARKQVEDMMVTDPMLVHSPNNIDIMKEENNRLQGLVDKLLIEINEYKTNSSEYQDKINKSEYQLQEHKTNLQETDNEIILLNEYVNQIILITKQKLNAGNENSAIQLEIEKRKCLEILVASAKEEIIKINEINDELRIKNDKYSQKIEKLEKDFATVDRHAKRLEITIIDLQKFINASQEKLSESEKSVAELIKNLEERDAEIEIMKNIDQQPLEDKEVVKNLEEKDAVIEIMKNQIQFLEEKLKTQTEKMKRITASLKAKMLANKTMEEKIKGLENKIQETNAEIRNSNTKDDEMVKAQNKIQMLRTELENKIQDINYLEAENNKWQDKLKIESQNKEMFERENQLLNQRFSEFSLEVDSLKEKSNRDTSEANSKLAEKEQELIFSKDCIRSLEQVINNMKNETSVYQNMNEELNSTIEAVEYSCSEKEKVIAEMDNKINVMETEYQDRENNLLEEINREKYKLLHDLSELKKQVEEQKSIILNHDEVMEDMKRDHNRALSAIEAKWQEKEAVIESLEQDLHRSNARVQFLEENLHDVEARRLSLESKAGFLNLQLEESMKDKQEVIKCEEFLEHEINTLKNNEISLRGEIKNLLEENEKLNQNAEDFLAVKRELENDIFKSENVRKQLQNEIERLSSYEPAYNEATNINDTLQNELKKSELKIDSLMSHIESLELDIKNLNYDVEKSTTERTNLIENFDHLNIAKSRLEEEIDELNEQFLQYQYKVSMMEDELKCKEEELQEKDDTISHLMNQEFTNKKDTLDNLCQTEEIVKNDTENQEYKSEINHLQHLLLQKEEEVKNYQTRLLQSQFGNTNNGKNCLESINLDLENNYKKEILCLQSSNEELKEKIKEFQSKELEQIMEDKEINTESNENVSFEQINCSSCHSRNLEEQNMMLKILSLETEKKELIDTLNKEKSKNDEIKSNEIKNEDEVMLNEVEKNVVTKEGNLFKCEEDMRDNHPKIHEENELTEMQNADILIDFGESVWKADEDVCTEAVGWNWNVHATKEKLQRSDSTEKSEQISSLENDLKKAICENEKISEELNVAQVRGSKLVKKIKSLKLTVDMLNKQVKDMEKKNSEDVFDNLDKTIEEEFKLRISTLESEIRNIKTERDTLKCDNDNLLKRIDVLITANEQYMEIKEKQDFNVEAWEYKNRELKNEVEALQWKIDELTDNLAVEKNKQQNEKSKEEINEFEATDVKTKVADMEEQISALANDNEELQSLLEEQRRLRLVAEASLKAAEQKFLSEIENLEKEDSNRNENGRQRYDSCNQFKALKEEYRIQDVTLLAEKDRTEGEVTKTDIDLPADNNEIIDLRNKLIEQSEEIIRLEEEVASKHRSLSNRWNKEVELENERKKINKIVEEYNDFTNRVKVILSDFQEIFIQLEKDKEENSLLRTEFARVMEKLKETEGNNKILLDKKEELEVKFMNFKEESESCREKLMNEKIKIEQKLQKIIELNQGRDDEINDVFNQKELEIQTLQNKLLNMESDIQMQIVKSENGREMEIQHLDEKGKELEDLIIKKEGEICALRVKINDLMRDMQELYKVKDSDIKNIKLQLEKKELELEELSNKRAADVCNIQLQMSQNQSEFQRILEGKCTEIEILKVQLNGNEDKFNESSSLNSALMENYSKQLENCQSQLKDMTLLREKDIENLNIVLKEKEGIIQILDQEIKDKDEKIMELSQILEEESGQLSELRDLIEKRDLEIIKLKHHSLSDDGEKKEVDKPVESNPKQEELDFALHMLYKRDLRCEELTAEIVQLLGERDTLQLRLSTALRLIEELREKLSVAVPVPSGSLDKSVVSNPQNPPSTSVSEELLANKLSELHSVGYRQDVRIRGEVEQRHLEQKQIFQGGPGPIVLDTNYTLSRDVQSPSTVFFNWVKGTR